MIVRYTSIIGSLVAELKDQTKVGQISEIIIDNNKLSIAAIALDLPFWSFEKNKFILSFDIVHLLKDGAIINSENSIIDLEESILLQRMIKEKYFGIGQRVVTSNGTYIGRVYDFLIESDNLTITKFYVKNILAERIIPVSKVISLEGKTITIRDNYTSNRIENVAMAEVDAISGN